MFSRMLNVRVEQLISLNFLVKFGKTVTVPYSGDKTEIYPPLNDGHDN